MDRSRPSAAHRATAVRTAGGAALNLLPPASAGECEELAAVARARRAVPEVAVLRQPQDGRRVRRGPPSRPAANAHSGNRSSLSQAAPESPGSRPPDLSVPVARRGDRAPQPGLVDRYYLYSDAWWLSVPGRGDGLVQPVRAELGTIQHDGNRLLPGRARRRISLRPARNLELRSGLTVHLGGLSGSAPTAGNLHQYGRTRPRARQRVHRTAVAQFEVRTDLPRRLRHRPRTVPGVGELLPLLQSPASASGARLPNAGGPVSAQTQKEKVVVMMGDAVPQTPWDLALFFTRMDGFFFTAHGICRTIEMLDRNIGQRRDATRAPIQARNGWRPSGRRLGQPAAPSNDCRIFVQTMGSTSFSSACSQTEAAT